MSNYIRAIWPGGSFFFTLVTYNRQPIFKDIHSRRLLRKAWLLSMRKKPFYLEAICLLPEHIHFIMRLPENEIDYSTRIASIKGRFTKIFLSEIKTADFGTRRRGKGERTVWQHRFWEHMIKDENDFIRHVEYIHYNPVKHGHVQRVRDWPWSSFHRYVRQGVYPFDWGGINTNFECERFGE